MLKKIATSVLASLRGATYRSVRLASSFSAALLDSLFDHPAGMFSCYAARLSSSQTHVSTVEFWVCHNCFSAAASARGWLVLGRAWMCAERRTSGRCSGRTACRQRDASSSAPGTMCRGDRGGRMRAESGLVLKEWHRPCASFSPTAENLVNRSSGP